MISSDNCSAYEIYNHMLRSREEWDEAKDDYVTVYDNILPLTDIKNNSGVPFLPVQSIISALYAGEEILVATLFNETNVYLQGEIGHGTYEEAVYASITLSAWTEFDPDEMAAGGELFSVEARWDNECDPAPENEARKVLRWLYDCFQDEWNSAFSEACSVMGI